MGTYTKVVVRFTLKATTPPPVSIMLKLLVSLPDWDKLERGGLRHPSFAKPFFQQDCSWQSFFGDFTYHEGQCHRRWVDALTLDSVASIKNYHSEVEKFWEWIQEYVDRTKPYEVSAVSNEIQLDGESASYTFLETDVKSSYQDLLHECICCDCGTHRVGLWGTCCVCGSRRLSLTSVIRNIAGDAYMKSFYTLEKEETNV